MSLFKPATGVVETKLNALVNASPRPTDPVYPL